MMRVLHTKQPAPSSHASARTLAGTPSIPRAVPALARPRRSARASAEHHAHRSRLQQEPVSTALDLDGGEEARRFSSSRNKRSSSRGRTPPFLRRDPRSPPCWTQESGVSSGPVRFNTFWEGKAGSSRGFDARHQLVRYGEQLAALHSSQPRAKRPTRHRVLEDYRVSSGSRRFMKDTFHARRS